MNGRYAISTAGHDAGKIYIIVGYENGRWLLSDGVEHKIANCKKKNAKHVVIPNQEAPVELATIIEEKRRGCDEAIRQTLYHLNKDNLRYRA